MLGVNPNRKNAKKISFVRVRTRVRVMVGSNVTA